MKRNLEMMDAEESRREEREGAAEKVGRDMRSAFWSGERVRRFMLCVRLRLLARIFGLADARGSGVWMALCAGGFFSGRRIDAAETIVVQAQLKVVSLSAAPRAQHTPSHTAAVIDKSPSFLYSPKNLRKYLTSVLLLIRGRYICQGRIYEKKNQLRPLLEDMSQGAADARGAQTD
jgi:hypothetical protein